MAMADEPWTLDPEIDAYLATMELPPEPFMQELMAQRMPIEEAAPREGDPAPDFRAELLTADGVLSGDYVSLADYRGRPLALLLGSYTCPIYRGQLVRFNEIYAELSERLAFLFIYISEAHPEDGWQVGINHSQDVVYAQPAGCAERAAVAADCIAHHGITMPVAIDDMDDTIGRLYSAAPERLWLIGADGVIRHRSAMGPFNMGVVDEWYRALQA
jgi:hypothetical protein